MDQLRRFLTISLRRTWKEKGYAFINVAGLAMAMACGLLIFLFVRHELSFDDFHEHAGRTFRLVDDWEYEQRITRTARTPAPWGPALKRSFPEVAEVVRVRPYSRTLVERGNKRQYEQRFALADSAFFEVFSYRLIQGDPATVLDRPNSVVITETIAERYFGNADPIGETLTVEHDETYRVTGVAEDFPPNSQLDFDFVASFSAPGEVGSWTGHNFFTYLLLEHEIGPGQLEARLPGFLRRQMSEEAAARYAPSLQPITDIHLHSDREGELQPGGDILYVRVSVILALLVLIVACVNFVNLTTARSTRRAIEVGIRRTVGARRRQLMSQFMLEAVLTSVAALAVAVGICWLALPAVDDLYGGTPNLRVLLRPSYALVLVGAAVGVGILAGSYPAFVLSSYRPGRVLRGQSQESGLGSGLRRGLVVGQFAVAFVMLVSTAVIYQQLDYIAEKDLGFDERGLVTIALEDDAMRERFSTVKAELREIPGVERVTASSVVPGQEPWGFGVRPEGQPGRSSVLPTLSVDADFVETMGMRMAAGRDFSPAFSTDSSAALLNEAAAEHFGWDDPVGRELVVDDPFRGDVTKRVVGVVENFHYASFQQTIGPMILYLRPRLFRYASVRVGGENLPETVSALEETWSTFDPNRPFDYFFLEEKVEQLHRDQARFGEMCGLLAGVAVLIGCLGLFGLASYSTRRRTKEVGVRKVLGATAARIVGLLTADFLKLVGLAIVIGVPVSYLTMSRWLQAFAYRIDLGPGVFLLAGTAAVLIAFLTVSSQSLRAALLDPTESLRYE